MKMKRQIVALLLPACLAVFHCFFPPLVGVRVGGKCSPPHRGGRCEGQPFSKSNFPAQLAYLGRVGVYAEFGWGFFHYPRKERNFYHNRKAQLSTDEGSGKDRLSFCKVYSKHHWQLLTAVKTRGISD